MKKIISAILLLSLTLCVFASCGGDSSSASSSPASDVSSEDTYSDPDADAEDTFSDEINTVGNASEILSNGGYFARQGKVLYFRNEDMDGKLSVMNNDGTGKKIVTSDVTLVNNINVIGDTVFFASENGGIYSVKTDGTGLNKLSDVACSYMTVAGDKIIFAVSSAEKTVISTSPVSVFEPTEIANASCAVSSFAYASNTVYYNPADTSSADGVKTASCIFGADIREPMASTLYNGVTTKFSIIGNTILAYNNGTMTVYDIASSSQKASFELKAAEFTFDGEYIYYTSSENFYLHKIKADGSEDTVLNAFESFNLSLIGTHIYYNHTSTVNPSGCEIWRIQTNGKNDRRVMCAIF